MKKEILTEKINLVSKEFGIRNVMAAPKLLKIMVNMGLGNFKDDKNFMASAKKDISLITGQMPTTRPAKKSIAGFKIRQGDIVGLSVTLRGKRMWDFYEKLTKIVLPRLRDFRGLSRKAFDKNGNYTLGINDHTVFSEIDANKVDKVKNFQITLVTTAQDNETGYKLLKVLGFPFRD